MSLKHKVVGHLVHDMLRFNLSKGPGPLDRWRVHGIGMMQLYLPDDVRLHIWHKQLRVTNVSMMHTHAWDFTSHVLWGEVYNRRYVESEWENDPVFHKYKINPGPKPEPVLLGEVHCKPLKSEVFREGHSYTQKHEEIHYSNPDDGTVTLVERDRGDIDDAAFIYCHQAHPFVSAAPRTPTVGEIHEVLSEAISLGRKGRRC